MKQTAINKLIIHKMSKDAIPANGGLKDGIKFLSSSQNISEGFKKAKEWVNAAVIAVRLAKDPNPWKHSTDEEIAAEILNKIEERSKRRV